MSTLCLLACCISRTQTADTPQGGEHEPQVPPDVARRVAVLAQQEQETTAAAARWWKAARAKTVAELRQRHEREDEKSAPADAGGRDGDGDGGADRDRDDEQVGARVPRDRVRVVVAVPGGPPDGRGEGASIELEPDHAVGSAAVAVGCVQRGWGHHRDGRPRRRDSARDEDLRRTRGKAITPNAYALRVYDLRVYDLRVHSRGSRTQRTASATWSNWIGCVPLPGVPGVPSDSRRLPIGEKARTVDPVKS